MTATGSDQANVKVLTCFAQRVWLPWKVHFLQCCRLFESKRQPKRQIVIKSQPIQTDKRKHEKTLSLFFAHSKFVFLSETLKSTFIQFGLTWEKLFGLCSQSATYLGTMYTLPWLILYSSFLCMSTFGKSTVTWIPLK